MHIFQACIKEYLAIVLYSNPNALGTLLHILQRAAGAKPEN
jgi:hypothetical protein